MVEEIPAYFSPSASRINNKEDGETLRWCSVSLSEIISTGKRLEASVFDPEGKRARQLVENGKYPYQHITGEDGLASAYRLGQFKRIKVPKSNYPFYQPSTILDVMPEPDGYLSKKTEIDLDSLKAKKWQVLVTRSGTIGNVTLVSDTLENKCLSDDLIRIDFDDKSDAAFVYTYLKSDVGRKIVLTNQYGSVISHIEPEHFDTVSIPIIPDTLKQKISDLILSSFTLRDESNKLWEEATKTLYHELKLIDYFEFQKAVLPANLSFTVKLSELNNRCDCSYHIPIVKKIIAHLEKHAEEVTTVGDERISSAVILPGRFKRTYVSEGHGRVFIGGKQITELDPSNKKYLSEKAHSSRIKTELELKENMILITCSGTIGKISLVPKHWDNWAASQHIIRVVPASSDIAGYLAAYLSTPYGKELVTRFTYGAVVDEIDASHVSNVAVPLLKNKDVQKKINDLILSANQKRYEAYVLERRALNILQSEVFDA